MKIPCIVIDLKTNKRYTIDQFASQLHNGLLKDLVNEKIIDNTKLKGRTELLNVSAKATEEVKAKTRNVVEKAFNSVKNLIKKTTGKEAKLEYAKNRDEMIALVKSHGGTEADATARGYYYGKDGTIVINEEYATSDTGGHEPSHPIVDALAAYKPEVLDKFVRAIGNIKGGEEFIESAKLGYPTLEGELPKLNELLEKAKADGKTEIANKLQERIDNINRDITQQKKEIVTDFFAKIADGTFKVDQTNYEMVRDYILQALKAMGIKLSEQNLNYLDQKAVTELAKLVAEKFSKGEEITAKDLGLEKFELIGEQNKLQQMKTGEVETKIEPTTFTTRSGEPIGFNYNTDMVARERFDISKLKRLGGGSDRDVFDLGDGKLLKVAKTARGLEQNIYEGDGYLSFVPEMYERGANYVVVEKAEAPLVSNKGGAELQAMLKDLSRFNQEDFDKHNPELVKALEKYGLEDAMSYRVIWNDFTAKRNWGLKDGEPVHLDGGTFGGIKMLDRYRGKTNLSDPEFRRIYNESKDLKKQFGDTDKFRQFSKSEVGETVEGTTKALDDILNDFNVASGLDFSDGTPNESRSSYAKMRHAKNRLAKKLGFDIGNLPNLTESQKETRNSLYYINKKLGYNGEFSNTTELSEAYLKAKADGTNPELVKAVESMFGTPTDTKSNLQLSKSQLNDIDNNVAKDIEYTKESGGTQVATTIGSYKKAATIIKDLGVEGDVLDYGAGLGLGSDAMSEVLGKNVDSYEPNPERWKGKNNVTYEKSSEINKKYDSIVSLNVVNVVSKEIRDSIIKDIYNHLNDGGKAIISSRKWEGDISRTKNFKVGEEPNSLYTSGRYQKGFDGNELVDYIKEVLGDKVSVKKDNSFGATGVIITKLPQEGGMQFSKSEIPNAPEEVSIKNAAIDEARAARGAEPVATQARQTWGEAWDKAVVKVNNGESPEVLAKDIARSPRSLNDVEHAMLFMNELDLNNKYWNLIDQINKGEGDIKNLETQLDDVKRKLEDNEYAIRASGTETARGLAIRRWSKKADYSAEALKAEARAANKGVELDETTKKALEDKAKEIEEAQKKSEEYDATRAAEIEEKRRKEAEAAEKKALKELEEKLAFKTATRDEINTYIDKRRNKLADLISKRNESKGGIQRAKSELPVDYDQLIEQEIKEIAKGYFALGNMDMNSLVKAVHEDLQGLDPSFTERDVRDAISGYKSSKPRMTKPAIDVEMQDLKAQMKAVSKLEDMSKGLPKQEGEKPTPPAKSKALTDLENQLADKMKEQKLWNELEQLSKEGLPEPKTRGEKRQLSQDIQDLEQMIAEKKKELQLKEKIADVEQGNLPAKGQAKDPLSAELQKLQDEYNKKKRLLEISKELEDVRSGNRKAPATKVEVDADVKAAQEQLAEVKRIDDMIKKSAELDRLDQDVNYLNQEIDRLRQMAEDTGDSDYTQMADNMQQHLNNLIEQNKKKPKQTKPRTQQEIDLANDIKKKSRELGIDGSDEAKLKAAKTRMQNRIDELQRMIDTRNFDKPEKQEVVLDEEGLRLKAEVERKKKEADRIIEEERIKNMTPFERKLDTFNKFTRATVLSGIPVIGKLISAGATRTMVAKPLETIIGIGVSKLMPKTYRKAVVEGGDVATFRKAQVKAMVEWFKKENWIPDMVGNKLFGKDYKSEFSKVLGTGSGELDLMFGDKKYGMDDSNLEFFGRLHASLKSPTKRAEWLRAWEYRSLKALEMGENIDNADVQYRIGAEAYIDAQKAIFMGDNPISQSYTNWLNQLERGGTGAKLTGAFMRMLIPVVKIPTNFAIETLEYSPGVGASKAIYTILKNGFDNLTPQQADYIIKIAKKQGAGFALFAIGAMNSDNIGGYYQENEKRGRNDVKVGDIRTPFGDVSHTFLHSPAFEILMMGATAARLYKKEILEGKSSFDASVTGGFEAITGLTGQIPQAPAIQDLDAALKSDEGFTNWLGSVTNRVIFPQLEKNIASVFEEKTTEGENVKRQPRGFTEQLLKGTGFDTAPIKMADYVDMTLGKDYKETVAVLSKAGALDDLTDITTRKYSVFNEETGKFTTIYLERNQLNELNQLVRDKYIALIKANPVLSAKDPLKAFYDQLAPSAQAQFDKLSKERQGALLKNLTSNLLQTAKAQAKYEKGLTQYDESKVTE